MFKRGVAQRASYTPHRLVSFLFVTLTDRGAAVPIPVLHVTQYRGQRLHKKSAFNSSNQDLG